MGVDRSQLTTDQLSQLEAYEAAQKQLQELQDIASMAHEAINLLDEQKKTGSKTVSDFGALLVDIRESLTLLNDKQAPQMPDYAKPVVEALSRLETALSALNVSPVVNVPAPKVSVAPTPIDLSGVEKALSIMPKAFDKAISLIPKVEIPKTDFQPLLDAWEGISEQLVSIENATRMKPLPGSMKISNLDGIVGELQANNVTYDYWQFDADDSAPNYIGFNEDVAASDNDGSWIVYKLTYSGSNVTSLKKKTGPWATRVAMFT